jgi:hypothetical protein
LWFNWDLFGYLVLYLPFHSPKILEKVQPLVEESKVSPSFRPQSKVTSFKGTSTKPTLKTQNKKILISLPSGSNQKSSNTAAMEGKKLEMHPSMKEKISKSLIIFKNEVSPIQHESKNSETMFTQQESKFSSSLVVFKKKTPNFREEIQSAESTTIVAMQEIKIELLPSFQQKSKDSLALVVYKMETPKFQEKTQFKSKFETKSTIIPSLQ